MPTESLIESALLAEFQKFLLSSSKNTEMFSQELITAISVPTKVGQILVEAVEVGRDVVIAGTAGSGKTHLLKVVESELHTPAVEFGVPPPRTGSYVSVISDLTAVPPEDLKDVFKKPANCRSIVVCANEGALLAAARKLGPGSVFAIARDALHKIQDGERLAGEDGPVLIDAAGYDPTSEYAISSILALPLVKEYLGNGRCACGSEECLRKTALTWLTLPKVQGRISELVAAASLDAEGFTFRQIWNFVADILLGGDCHVAGGPPTGTWFWRVFYGESDISRRIRNLYPLSALAIPHVESRLWYGDWSYLPRMGALLRDIHLMVPSQKPCDEADANVAREVFKWLKAQMVFVSTANPVSRDSAAVGTLWSAALKYQHHDIIRAINRYMTYGFTGSIGNSLELWLDYAIERRRERPDGQISLGDPAGSEFEITRSYAVANIDLPKIPAGSRLFLRHGATGSVLPLTKDMLQIIVGGRSFRMSERRHTEIDWRLMRFFVNVGRKAATAETLRIALFNFGTRTMQQEIWDVVPGERLTLRTQGAYR